MPGDNKIDFWINKAIIAQDRLVVNEHEINTSGVQEFSEPMGLVIHAEKDPSNTGSDQYTGYSLGTLHALTIPLKSTTRVYFNGVDITTKFKDAAPAPDREAQSQTVSVTDGGLAVMNNNAKMTMKPWKNLEYKALLK